MSSRAIPGHAGNGPDSPWTPRLILGVVISAALLAGSLFWFVFLKDKQPTQWRIATGNAEGVYFRLGSGLEGIFGDHPKLNIQALETAGSRENMRLLEAGEVELALVQDDTPGGSNARTIALLHREYLHVLLRSEIVLDVLDMSQLQGLRVAVGAEASGTAAVAGAVLRHFDLEPERMTIVHCAPDEIQELLASDQVDVAFVLSALPSQVVDQACTSGAARLLSIGSGLPGETAADGIAAADPRFTKGTIPARTYGSFPETVTHTISVNAALIASRHLDEDLVRELTAQLFANRVALSESHPVALSMREKYEPWAYRYPAHEGAVAFYSRNLPSFIVRYAETIALLITVLVGIASALATLSRLAAHRRKELIDFYYKEVAAIASRAGADGVKKTRHQLLQLRAEAFQHLVGEKLKPDESFTIFQDFLRVELEGIAHVQGR